MSRPTSAPSDRGWAAALSAEMVGFKKPEGEGWLTATEIAVKFGCTHQTALTKSNRLVKKGVLEKCVGPSAHNNIPCAYFRPVAA